MKKSILIGSILVAFISHSAAAYNTITFNGLVKETTCTITSSAGATGDFTVNLPVFSPDQFTASAGTKIASSKQSFKIIAKGESCESAKIYLSSSNGNGEAGILVANNTAGDKSIKIKVENDAGASVAFNDYTGMAATTGDLALKTSEFDFNAYYFGDSTAPSADSYTATVTYIVTHQ